MLTWKSIDEYLDRIAVGRRRFVRAMREKTGPHASLYHSLAEDLPSDAAVGDLIQKAFYASLETDERRDSRVRMQWLHPALGFFELARFERHLPIDSPRVLTKLSQVTPTGGSLRLVLENDAFVVAGLCFTSTRHVDRRQGFRNSFPGCAITIHGVAHIEYQQGAWSLWYDKGSVAMPKTIWRRAPVKRFIQNLEQHIIPGTLSGEQVQGDTLGPLFSPLEMLTELLGELLTSILSSGHGGTVAILPDGSVKGLTIRYAASSNAMIESSRRYAEVLVEQSRARVKLQELNHINEEDRIQLLLAAMYPPEGRAQLVSTYRGIASLASADGAVVLNRDLSLRGFGGIVDLRCDADVEAVPVCNSSGQVVAENEVLRLTGTRHLAALRLAQRVPESIVFVFSEDGGVRAFCREDNVVWHYDRFRW